MNPSINIRESSVLYAGQSALWSLRTGVIVVMLFRFSIKRNFGESSVTFFPFVF